MFILYRGTIGEADSKTMVGIWETWNQAAKDMDTLGFSADSFYMIEEVTA